MSTTVPPRHELVALLRRAAGADDLEAFGDFIAATEGKAGELLGALGCDRASWDEVLVDCYRELWAERATYDGCGLSPLAWLLVRVRDAATRGGALPIAG